LARSRETLPDGGGPIAVARRRARRAVKPARRRHCRASGTVGYAPAWSIRLPFEVRRRRWCQWRIRPRRVTEQRPLSGGPRYGGVCRLLDFDRTCSMRNSPARGLAMRQGERAGEAGKGPVALGRLECRRGRLMGHGCRRQLAAGSHGGVGEGEETTGPGRRSTDWEGRVRRIEDGGRGRTRDD
jgi:hypothetical protein